MSRRRPRTRPCSRRGVNPADGALFIATHTGLYRVEEGERKAERVGERYQDTMGFTLVVAGSRPAEPRPPVRALTGLSPVGGGRASGRYSSA